MSYLLLFSLLLFGVFFSGCGDSGSHWPTPDASQGDSTNNLSDTSASPDLSGDTQTGDTSAPVDVDTTPNAPPEITVATFNVERFFDMVCDTGDCSFGDYEEQPARSQFTSRADQIAEAILLLDSDIVILQEVESNTCLSALRERLASHYQVFILGETGGNASVDVAIIARGELLTTISHQTYRLLRDDGRGTTFARDFLEAHISLRGNKIIVFAAHFISKLSGDTTRRRAEAEGAHDIMIAAAQANPDALVLLGGDLNDTPEAWTLEPLADAAFLRAASDLGADGTYLFDGNPQAIDHIFSVLSSKGQYVSGSAEVFWDAGLDGFGGSDHRALRAAFTFDE